MLLASAYAIAKSQHKLSQSEKTKTSRQTKDDDDIVLEIKDFDPRE